MEVNAQLNGAAILIRRIFTGTRFVGGLIEHRASVDISEKEKNSCLRRLSLQLVQILRYFNFLSPMYPYRIEVAQ